MRLIVHIGSPKTGSSALQSACVRNANTMRDAGVLYPEAGRSFDERWMDRHVGMRFAMPDPDPEASKLMGYVGLNTSSAKRIYADGFAAAFDAEIAAWPNSHTVFMSDEALFRFARRSTIESLHDFARRRFSSVSLLCYLKHPVDYLSGFYSQNIKNGDTDTCEEFVSEALSEGLFLPRLKRFRKCFRDDQLDVQIMSKDILAAFEAKVGVTGLFPLKPVRSNQSLSPLGLDVVHRLNNHYLPGRSPPVLRHVVERSLSGDAWKLPLELAQQVVDSFSDEIPELTAQFLWQDDDKKRVRCEWTKLPPSVVNSGLTPSLTGDQIAALIADIHDLIRPSKTAS